MKTYVLTEEQETILNFARDISEAEIDGRAEYVDHQKAFPKEGLKILAEAGMTACTVPEIYGGAELDYWSQTAVIGEVAKKCASTAWALANTIAAAECILSCGKDEIKNNVLPILVSGENASVAGSDGIPGGPEVLTVFAEKKDDRYVLKGVKKHIPGAGYCAWYVIKANTDNGARWFAVSGEGLKAEYESERLGMKGCPIGEISFDGCTAELLEDDADRFIANIQALNMAAIAAGIAKGAVEKAAEYINQRVQFGKTIYQFENTQQVMAEMAAKTEASRALVWEAAHLKDSGEDYGVSASVAKLFAADSACIVTRKCLQLMGGYGYCREYPMERKMRDAKMCEILCGTSEDMKRDISVCFKA